MSERTETPDRVWRIVWANGGVRHKTDWSIHFDVIRGLCDDYRTDWPGAEVEMQSAGIDSVTDVETMTFGGSGSGD